MLVFPGNYSTVVIYIKSIRGILYRLFDALLMSQKRSEPGKYSIGIRVLYDLVYTALSNLFL